MSLRGAKIKYNMLSNYIPLFVISVTSTNCEGRGEGEGAEVRSASTDD